MARQMWKTLVMGLVVLTVANGAANEVPVSTVKLDIASQPLGDALSQFAQQSGLQVVFFSEVGKGLQAPRLEGAFSPEAALRQLLANTALDYQFIDARTVAIRAKSAQETSGRIGQSSAGSALRLAQAADAADQTSIGAESATAAPEPAAAEGLAELEEIVVTGTHIRGVHNRTAPIMVISSKDIDRTGYSTTQQLLRSIPQNFAGGQAGATEDGIFGPGSTASLNYTGASGANLRGLGNSSTLVLVNGRRLAPAGFGDVIDISLIPLAAIDRVEILTDGSSAVYGSDAVAGVINVILRSDYEGAETRLRYGSVTEGDRTESIFSQLLGREWGTGGALLSLQYQDAEALSADDRDFASALALPNDLLPESQTYGATFDFHQKISQQSEARLAALLTKRSIFREITNSFGDFIRSDADTTGGVVNGALRFESLSGWSAELNAQFSQIDSDGADRTLFGATENDFRSRVSDIGVLINGRLARLPGGDLSLAAGTSYRDEKLNGETLGSFGASSDVTRNVASAFVEFYAPLVAPSRNIPLVRNFDVSLAVRYEDYSDFGDTTNPRLGLLWSPTEALSFRAAYSTSFRAPTLREKTSELATPGVFETVLADPNGPGIVPILQYFGGGVGTLDFGGGIELGPEEADTWSVGLDYRPAAVPGLSFGLNYYDIEYKNRILVPFPPFDALLDLDVYGPLVIPLADDAAAQAVVDDITSRGGFAFVGSLSGVRHLFDGRQRNVGVVKQSGIDLNAGYQSQLSHGTLSFTTGATFINHIDTALLPGAPATDVADTFANPLDFRARLTMGWSESVWGVDGTIEHYGSYRNTAAAGEPPIDSWTTLDSRIYWNPTPDSTVALSVQNVFDEDPPFVNATASFVDVNYDPGNASPLGRFWALELRKSW